MLLKTSGTTQIDTVPLDATASLIAETQRSTGEIPWSEGGKTDPWDLVEAAMGLATGGYTQEAKRAFQWMKRMQLADGSWYSAYRDGRPEDFTRETNMTAYIAVGVFHYYLATGDQSFLLDMWDTVRSAMEFTLRFQAPTGEIYWAISPENRVDPMALLTGSSSIYMSIKCALAIARETGHSRPDWNESLGRLANAIRDCPSLFNMTKSRYSMDWFYPILCGAVTGENAQRRIEKHWKKFVVETLGVRCVSDRPWITVAETSELVLALAAMGNTDQSEIVFNWILDRRYEDGSYWCGFTFPDMVVWPEDKLTWTDAVVLMAADSLYHITPASRLFCHDFWKAPVCSSIPAAG